MRAGHEEKHEKLDPQDHYGSHQRMLMEFHFFTVGHFHVTVPLPVISAFAWQQGFRYFHLPFWT